MHCNSKNTRLMDSFSRTTWVSWNQKGKPFWVLIKQEIMEWHWHQVDHMQIIHVLLQTDNHTSTSSFSVFKSQMSS